MGKIIVTVAVAASVALSALAFVSAGVPGAQGERGARGEQGIPGQNGKDGRNGVDGKDANVFGAAGQDFYVPVYMAQGETVGGNVFATSSIGTVTYTAASFNNNISLIQHTAASAVTATLPASSTLTAFIPKSGDTKTIYLNAITSAVTLAGGTGTDLNTSNSTSTKLCGAGTLCRLDFVRKSTRDIEVLLTVGY